MECGAATASCDVHAVHSRGVAATHRPAGCAFSKRFTRCALLKASESLMRGHGYNLGLQLKSELSTHSGVDGRSISRKIRGVKFRRQLCIHQAVVHRRCSTRANAEKDTSGTQEEISEDNKKKVLVPTKGLWQFLSTSELWLQLAIFIFAAGFVDAGFSGDWSRIGVLSKETEAELQMAAVGIVPLAAILIWSLSQAGRSKNL